MENALNGRKSLELLRREPVDLVFMDIMTPDMDGYEAIAAIKSAPVVALTAKSLKDDRRRVLESGADDYLAKPMDYEVLINLAAAWRGKGVEGWGRRTARMVPSDPPDATI